MWTKEKCKDKEDDTSLALNTKSQKQDHIIRFRTKPVRLTLAITFLASRPIFVQRPSWWQRELRAWNTCLSYNSSSVPCPVWCSAVCRPTPWPASRRWSYRASRCADNRLRSSRPSRCTAADIPRRTPSLTADPSSYRPCSISADPDRNCRHTLKMDSLRTCNYGKVAYYRVRQPRRI